ncbi:hypothetical protein JW926_13480 [Candidatus Sumerlaeota bacterium]|nr:hypothetical protein [Candidatus Sumerlaeota bacterium]
MDVKDTFSILWRKIKANIDRSAFVVFFLLLVLMCGIYGYEVTRPEPEGETNTSGSLPEQLPNDNYNKCLNYIKSNTDLEKNEELKIIKYFNIFDYKYIRDKNELQKEADKNFVRALKLYEEGKSDEAMKILKNILLTWPSHLSSRELEAKIQASRATPTPTPKRPAPGGPGMEGF